MFDSTPQTELEAPDARPLSDPPNGARLALDTVVAQATESLGAVRDIARMAGPGGGSGLGGTLRRAALAVEKDLLRPAPPSYLNVPIGPQRTLVCHGARMSDIVRARRGKHVTVNDVCLAAVAGALRELALNAGRQPRRLKVMVPVSVREDEGGALGNRISFTFIDLPVHLQAPAERLEQVNLATTAFKRSGRASGTELVLGALGSVLPGPLKGRAARMVASPRTYNLTVSNIPGPSEPLYMLGAELTEAYPVVPLADDHALSIGMFSYGERLHFGLYADPEALPDVGELPAALNGAIHSLARSPRRRARGDRAHRPGAREKPVRRPVDMTT